MRIDNNLIVLESKIARLQDTSTRVTEICKRLGEWCREKDPIVTPDIAYALEELWQYRKILDPSINMILGHLEAHIGHDTAVHEHNRAHHPELVEGEESQVPDIFIAGMGDIFGTHED